jgi:ribosome modulation factor
MSKKQIPPWHKLDCTVCGIPSEATRGYGKRIDVKAFVCSECETHERGYQNGLVAQQDRDEKRYQLGARSVWLQVLDTTRAL